MNQFDIDLVHVAKKQARYSKHSARYIGGAQQKGVTSKISKPAISSAPMKYCLLFLVSRVLLTRATSQLNIFAYTALDRAATEYTTWSLF